MRALRLLRHIGLRNRIDCLDFVLHESVHGGPLSTRSLNLGLQALHSIDLGVGNHLLALTGLAHPRLLLSSLGCCLLGHQRCFPRLSQGLIEYLLRLQRGLLVGKLPLKAADSHAEAKALDISTARDALTRALSRPANLPKNVDRVPIEGAQSIHDLAQALNVLLAFLEKPARLLYHVLKGLDVLQERLSTPALC